MHYPCMDHGVVQVANDGHAEIAVTQACMSMHIFAVMHTHAQLSVVILKQYRGPSYPTSVTAAWSSVEQYSWGQPYAVFSSIYIEASQEHERSI